MAVARATHIHTINIKNTTQLHTESNEMKTRENHFDLLNALASVAVNISLCHCFPKCITEISF